MMISNRLKAALLLLALLLPLGVRAQTEEPSLTLALHRNFGYAGAGRIQGRFTARALGPDDLTRVTFWIDNEPMGSVAGPPFEIVFSTGAHALGRHVLHATGETAGGVRLESAPIQVEFVSAEVSWEAGLKLAGPIVLGVLVLIAIGGLLTGLAGRRRQFELGAYGVAGGAVCPRCSLPFSRSVFAPNLLAGKLERCPHCGRWSLARRASRAQLDAAEARYREDAHMGEVELDSEESRYRRQLDESRFEG